jgi:hypothetical protein
VPDLEIVDGSLFYKGNDIGGSLFWGRIRNNTDTTMILPIREPAFIFNFTRNELIGGTDPKAFYRLYNWGPLGIAPGLSTEGSVLSNCIIYPREEGVILFDLSYMIQMEGYASTRIQTDDFSGPIGFFYSYRSQYRTSPDLDRKYHPKAENVIYSINASSLIFEFDVFIPRPRNYKWPPIIAWLIMYDNQGNILNVLYTDLGIYFSVGHPYNETLHIQSKMPPDQSVEFRWGYDMPVTIGQLQRLDHIEILVELQEEGICYAEIYPDR